MEFLTASMKVRLTSFEDDVEFRYQAQIKAVAINTGKVPMLPWESSMWEVGKSLG